MLRIRCNARTQPIGFLSGKGRVDNIETVHIVLVILDNSLVWDGIIGQDFIKNCILIADDNGYVFRINVM